MGLGEGEGKDQAVKRETEVSGARKFERMREKREKLKGERGKK